MRYISLTISFGLLGACVPQQADLQLEFMNNLSSLCGKAFAGKVISEDPQDADWVKETLIMHVRDCSDTEIKIPLHVGENRSRTWVISHLHNGLELKHDHRHEDGTPDDVTMYGGLTADFGTAKSQAFPVDDFSKSLFREEGLTASVENTWKISINPGTSFTYALSRPNRDFRAEFDLTKPIDIPPPVWGSE